MCVGVGSQFFWIGAALFAGLALLNFYTAKQFLRALRHADTAEAWAAALMDHLPVLVINGIWLLVVLLAARACGIGF